MNTYTVEITETLCKQIQVKACSMSEAIAKVKDDYRKEKIVLDESHFLEAEFEIIDFKGDELQSWNSIYLESKIQ